MKDAWCSDLCEKIIREFPQTPTPNNIVKNRHDDGAMIEQAFLGKGWLDVSKETIRYNHTALFFFSDDAFRYYLPAFMMAAIKNEDDDDSGMIIASVVSALTGPLDIDSPEKQRFLRRMKGFNVAQSKVIIEYLSYVDSKCSDWFAFDEPRRAIESYWLHGLQKPL
ncbi:MAG: hypothetical protein HS102_07815 [Planctomycetia bacterium]|nr:hypothetical protein [Planctomycetia bacterium]